MVATLRTFGHAPRPPDSPGNWDRMRTLGEFQRKSARTQQAVVILNDSITADLAPLPGGNATEPLRQIAKNVGALSRELLGNVIVPVKLMPVDLPAGRSSSVGEEASPSAAAFLTVVIQKELIRMRPQPDLVDLLAALE